MPFYWVSMQASRLLTSARPPMPLADAVARIGPRPILLISASNEREATLSQHLHALASPSATLWPETPHTEAMHTHPDA